MKILRYSPALHKLIRAKTFPEPWMHILFVPAYGQAKDACTWAIYIWDTRQILETGYARIAIDDIKGKPAKDNGKPLQGNNAGHFDFAFGATGKVTTIDAALQTVQAVAKDYIDMPIQKVLDQLGAKRVRIGRSYLEPTTLNHRTADAMARFCLAALKVCPEAISIRKDEQYVHLDEAEYSGMAKMPTILINWKRPVGEERDHKAANWQGLFIAAYNDTYGYDYDVLHGADWDVVKQIANMFNAK